MKLGQKDHICNWLLILTKFHDDSSKIVDGWRRVWGRYGEPQVSPEIDQHLTLLSSTLSVVSEHS